MAGKLLAAVGLALALALVPRATGGPGAPGSPGATASVRRETWNLPPEWKELEPWAFERLVERELPPAATVEASPAALAELALALDRMDPISVRAAVLLGRTRSAAASVILMERLERRIEGPTVVSDAADVCAAGALALFPGAPDAPRRLESLAASSRPHPDLEVRVECARAAMLNGRDGGASFLLKVLRIDTWAGRHDRRDFKPGPQTAWARSRAAAVLSWRAGLPCTYQAEGSIFDRTVDAARLKDTLRTNGALED